ncbi:barstar family protein [Saccharothrix syringae]|uniref:Barnase inhibitor n=1 Tax=Saccharothrix syringae TaxID=103733 RepID=A0A5Q0GUH1_SACSY|nr:barstar family protein [Saccharothrix syringae]QFZ17275.1 barnase inhibitor [Saccharothrix syringae]
MSTYRHHVRAGARTRREAIAAIADALGFPDWFGHNLDALHDSLTDLSWLPEGEHVLVWEGGVPEVEAVLADAAARTAELGGRVLTVVYTD